MRRDRRAARRLGDHRQLEHPGADHGVPRVPARRARARTTWDAWVVDNASADDSVAAIRASAPTVQVIANPHNVGFAAANNQGIAASRGRYVLLLNSDTVMARRLARRAGGASPTPARAAASSARCCSTPMARTRADRRPSRRCGTRLLAVTGVGATPDLSEATRAGSAARAATVAARPTTSAAPACSPGARRWPRSAASTRATSCTRRSRTGAGACGPPAGRCGTPPTRVVTHFGGQSTSQVRDAMLVALYRSKVRFFRQHRNPVVGGLPDRLVHGGQPGSAGGPGSVVAPAAGRRDGAQGAVERPPKALTYGAAHGLYRRLDWRT